MVDTPSLVIRGGTVIDGTGAEPFEADVAIAEGALPRSARAGPGARGDRRQGPDGHAGLRRPPHPLRRAGHLVEPIDPSTWNGVTTAMIGNCGVGFAPCKPEQRDMLVKLMEGVEDIPEVVLTEGLPWNWQSFEDYLDALEARPYDLDVVTQVPHAAVRVFVMGERGADREPATAEDRAKMAALAAAGVEAGALGFSTSRTINHKTLDGRHIPTLKADEAELAEIADGARQGGCRLAAGDLRFRRARGGDGAAAPAGRALGPADVDHHPAARQQARGMARLMGARRRAHRRRACR